MNSEPWIPTPDRPERQEKTMTAEPDPIAEAEEAVWRANRALIEIQGKVSAEKRAAEFEIEQRYRAALADLNRAASDAQKALHAAKDAHLPDHPWTGKRVYSLKQVGSVWDRRPPERIEGVVETVRTTTALPANTSSWSRPRLGAPIVRLLNKKGEPGLRFEPLSGWKLAEETTDER